jgi:hypothetical protein
MMMTTDVPDKNMAIAPPDRIECNPISSFVNPKISSPMRSTIDRR